MTYNPNTTSTDITDGTIVNADINASAAIADSKLSLTTTSSGTAISASNKIVDATSLNLGFNGYTAPNGFMPSFSTRSITVNNQIWWARFYAPANITATKIAAYISATGSATGTDWADFGIFNTSGTLLASTGQTTGLNTVGTLVATLGSGTGAKTGSANYALTAGTTYYIGVMTNLATLTGFQWLGCGASGGTTIFGTAAGQWLWKQATASGTTTSLNAATWTWPTVAATDSTGAGVMFVVRTD